MDACPKTNSVSAGGPHDVGGSSLLLDGDGSIDKVDHTLAHWELSTHALLVLLSSRSPQMMTTDELRRGVEALPDDTYAQWGYYEKWAAAMATILLERGVITAEEFDNELYGDENTALSTSPLFQEGDLVRVKSEDSRLRWRRPHLRCPGYIFGLVGKVEKYMGSFADPSLLAFRGKAHPQPLYVVKFLLRDTWESTCIDSQGQETTERDFEKDDCVTAEIYHGWLENVSSDGEEHTAKKAKHSHCESGANSHDHSHKHASSCEHHHHDGPHSHCESHAENHSHETHEHSHEHAHGHSHDHSHESRERVEQVAVEREGASPPGMAVALSLLRLLKRKGIVTSEALQKTGEALQNNGVKMLGAELVVRAWKDAAFKERLLTDACASAAKFGINTSNPNAPTILRVVANSPTTHHVIVCTLCSCYPAALLGLSPAWYKSRNYRARVVREPRVVLKEFGLELPENISVEVHDSTADLRYMVIPLPPATLSADDIATKSVEELKTFVTRDSMIGVAVL